MASIFTCEDHVDLALESAAEETLSPPLLEEINPAQQPSTTCGYVDKFC